MFYQKSNVRLLVFITVLTSIALLFGCGGGGGGSSTDGGTTGGGTTGGGTTGGGTDVAFVSGNVSYPSTGLTKPQNPAGGKNLLKINNSDLVAVAGAEVYLYTIDDTDFSNPVAGPITTDANGNYTVDESDFIAGFDSASQTSYVLRASFNNAGGQKIGLRCFMDLNDASITKDADGNPVISVDPITEIVVQTILTKIQEIFNEFGIVSIDPALWQSLVNIVTSIVQELTAQLENSDLTVDESYFYDDYTSSMDTTKSGASDTVEVSTASMLLDGAAADEIFKEGVPDEKKIVSLINVLCMLGFTVTLENSNEKCYAYVEPDFFRKPDGTLMEVTAENFPGMSIPEPITTDVDKQLPFNPNIYVLAPNDIFTDTNQDGFVDDSGVKVQGKDFFGRDVTAYTFNADKKFRLRENFKDMGALMYEMIAFTAANYIFLSTDIATVKQTIAGSFQWRQDGYFDEAQNMWVDGPTIPFAAGDVDELFAITLPPTAVDYVEEILSQDSRYFEFTGFAIEYAANKAVLDGLYANKDAFFQDNFKQFFDSNGTIVDGDGFFEKAKEIVKTTPMWNSEEEKIKGTVYSGISQQLYGQTFTDDTALDFRSAFVLIVLRLTGIHVIDPLDGFAGGLLYQRTDMPDKNIEPNNQNFMWPSPTDDTTVIKEILVQLFPDIFGASYTGDYENLAFDTNTQTLLESMQFDTWWNKDMEHNNFEQLPDNTKLTLTQNFKSDVGPLASYSMELYYDMGQDAWASTHNSTSDVANFISSVTTDENGMLTLEFDNAKGPLLDFFKGYFVKFTFDVGANGTDETFVWYFWADMYNDWVNHDGEDYDNNGDGVRDDVDGNGYIDYISHWGFDKDKPFDPANPQWPFYVGEWKPMMFPYAWVPVNNYVNFGYDIEGTPFMNTDVTQYNNNYDILVMANSQNKLVMVPNNTNGVTVYKLNAADLDAALGTNPKQTFTGNNIYAAFDAGFTIDFYASKGTDASNLAIEGDTFSNTGEYMSPSIYLIRTGDSPMFNTERAYLLRVFKADDMGFDFEFATIFTAVNGTETNNWTNIPPNPFEPAGGGTGGPGGYVPPPSGGYLASTYYPSGSTFSGTRTYIDREYGEFYFFGDLKNKVVSEEFRTEKVLNSAVTLPNGIGYTTEKYTGNADSANYEFSDYYGYDSATGALMLYGFADGGGLQIFDTPITLLPASSNVFDTVSGTTNMDIYDNSGTTLLQNDAETLSFEVTVYGTEDVDVPAGHFAGCLHITLSITDANLQTDTMETWYAPGIGEVRSIEWKGFLATTLELAAYDVNNDGKLATQTAPSTMFYSGKVETVMFASNNNGGSTISQTYGLFFSGEAYDPSTVSKVEVFNLANNLVATLNAGTAGQPWGIFVDKGTTPPVLGANFKVKFTLTDNTIVEKTVKINEVPAFPIHDGTSPTNTGTNLQVDMSNNLTQISWNPSIILPGTPQNVNNPNLMFETVYVMFDQLDSSWVFQGNTLWGAYDLDPYTAMSVNPTGATLVSGQKYRVGIYYRTIYGTQLSRLIYFTAP
ncbi:MAG: hypothetical protein HZA48_11250 [Planctomycetes bacterium]|nr:hypothetical protein [Planctomycetota bacterium]